LAAPEDHGVIEEEYAMSYHPDDDIPTDQPFYHPSAKEARKLRQLIIDIFRAQLKNGLHDDEGLTYLSSLLAELEKPPREAKPLQVTVDGDAGQGKSSTINCLIGIEGLAPQARNPMCFLPVRKLMYR
jgi:hypothetical protein